MKINHRGIGCLGALLIGAIFVIAIGYFYSGEKSVMEKIGNTYKYRGTFTNEVTGEDAIDVFGDVKNFETVKSEIVSFLKPLDPPQANSESQYIINYKD